MSKLMVDVWGCKEVRAVGNKECKDVCEESRDCKFCPINEVFKKLAAYEEMDLIDRKELLDLIDQRISYFGEGGTIFRKMKDVYEIEFRPLVEKMKSVEEGWEDANGV